MERSYNVCGGRSNSGQFRNIGCAASVKARKRFLRKYQSIEPEGGAPGHAQARWRLGQLLEKEGRRAEAIAEIEQAVRLTPDLEDAKKDRRCASEPHAVDPPTDGPSGST